MENKLKTLSEKEETYYIKLLTERFLDNPRMQTLFGEKSSNNYKKSVNNLVKYCYHLANKLNGVYLAKNKETIVLFYEKQHFKQNVSDYWRYFKIAKGIGVSRIKSVIKKENEIKKQKLKLDNYLYVWFIAQNENYRKVDGIIEIKKMLLDYAKERNLPILLETSNNLLLNLYRRGGFEVYNTYPDGENTVYFMVNNSFVK